MTSLTWRVLQTVDTFRAVSVDRDDVMDGRIYDHPAAAMTANGHQVPVRVETRTVGGVLQPTEINHQSWTIFRKNINCDDLLYIS